MYQQFIWGVLFAIFTTGQLAFAKKTGTYLNYVNLTPYDWVLTYNHSYQIDWKPPAVIPAKSTHEQYIRYHKQHGDNGDCAAEAFYNIAGSPQPASFQVLARQHKGKHIYIQYGGDLESLGNKKNAKLDLGWYQDSALTFMLAGEHGSYVGTNPPIGWMQATLSTIKNLCLRQIAMPASHDAGMSEQTSTCGGLYILDFIPVYLGSPHNTITQSGNIYKQLLRGARYFDIRPVHWAFPGAAVSDWFAYHTTVVKAENNPNKPFEYDYYWNRCGDLNCTFRLKDSHRIGGFGREIWKIVNDINQFTADHPGELIILEISHEADAQDDTWTEPIPYSRWEQLYDILGGINDLWNPSEMFHSSLPKDLSTAPIRSFITKGGPSAVIIRIPDHAPLPHENSTYPRRAFQHFYRLPQTGSYTGTTDESYLAKDQLYKLATFRRAPGYPMHRSTWTVTQAHGHVTNIAIKVQSLLSESRRAHKVLFSKLLDYLLFGQQKVMWPNLIEMDNFRSLETASLSMVINEHWAKHSGMPGDIDLQNPTWGRIEDSIRHGSLLIEGNELIGERSGGGVEMGEDGSLSALAALVANNGTHLVAEAMKQPAGKLDEEEEIDLDDGEDDYPENTPPEGETTDVE